jgi:mono/diheme cytochrome c family protein
MSKPLLGLALLGAALAGCGPAKSASAPPSSDQPTAAAASPAGSDLTPFEQKNGIGPVKQEIALDPLDKARAEQGEKVFETKCSACHKMSERYVGPALGKVTERRTPAYIMNMILNPQEMYTRHPVAKQLLAEHLTQMPNQGLSQDEARAVVEYFRTQADKPDSK